MSLLQAGLSRRSPVLLPAPLAGISATASSARPPRAGTRRSQDGKSTPARSSSTPATTVCAIRSADGGHAEHPGARAMRLRYLHRPHRRRKIRPRRHPIPDLIEVVPSDPSRSPSIDCPSTPARTLVRLDPLVRLPHQPLRYLKRLARRLQLAHASPPRELLVDRANKPTNEPAPSLRPHYRSFTATTSRSASASRDGTQRLAVSAPLGALPLATPASRAQQYQDTPSHVPHGSRRPGSRRLHAGHRLASQRAPARLIPGSP